MSENIELAERAYELLQRGELEEFIALTHPDVEFGSLIAESEGRRFKGHEGVREWWEQVAGSIGGLRFEPQAYHDMAHGAYTELLVTGTIQEVEIPQVMWQAVEIRDGKVAAWDVFRREAEAREWLEARKRDA